jgi:hypothetical protein
LTHSQKRALELAREMGAKAFEPLVHVELARQLSPT